MAKKKSQYALLFEHLYEKYIEDGDNDFTWSYIFFMLNDFMKKLVNGSQLFSQFFDEGLQAVRIAVMNSFRTYDKTKNASLFTWATFLSRQAIIILVKDKTKLVNCDYLEEIELDVETDESSAEQLVYRKENEEKEKELQKRITKLLGGPLEAEVFSRRFGLFGYEEMKIDEIAEEMRLTKKTIYLINIKNNKVLKQFRSVQSNIDELLK